MRFAGHRPEGPQTHVQRHLAAGNSLAAQVGEDLGGKVQPGGGGGHGAPLAGIHRLVAVAVVEFVGPANVGGQGDVAQPVHDAVEVTLVFEAQHPQAPFAPPRNHRLQLAAAEQQALADPNPAARLDQRFPGVLAQGPHQQHFDGGFQHPSRGRLVAGQAGPVSDQAGREDLGVVQNQQVPGGQQLGQLGESVVGDPTAGSNQPQEAGLVALFGGVESNPVAGQRVFEVGTLHPRQVGTAPPSHRRVKAGVRSIEAPARPCRSVGKGRVRLAAAHR